MEIRPCAREVAGVALALIEDLPRGHAEHAAARGCTVWRDMKKATKELCSVRWT